MMLESGDTIGAYRIIERIGQGGMATVYRAHHERLGRDVAIKIMHPTFLSDDNFMARFSREARIVAGLDHPNIVPIFDFSEHNGLPYLVMRYIAGPTLKFLAMKEGLTLQNVADILTQVASGMDYAHSQGVLHRDMKPSNIIIEHNTRAYITDFGLARIAQAGESTISHDMMLGTPYYISPEQAQGERTLTHHTDIYSLGVILYELVTGQVPFSGDTPYAIVHGHIYTPPPSPLVINPELPEPVEAVLMKALAKEPQQRYNSAGAMIEAFKAAMKGVDPNEPISSVMMKPPEQITRNRAPANEPVTSLVEQSAPEQDRRKSHDGTGLELEASFSLGDMDWSQIGERINTGIRSFAEMIEERIDSELHDRRGISKDSIEEQVRRRVRKRMKARQEFIGHLSAFIGVNAMLFAIWFFTSGLGSFPWPIIPALGWGIGLMAHGGDYYSKYGPGAEKREADMEREIERELQRERERTGEMEAAKSKNDRRVRLVDEPPQVRLNADGELTDSFIEEADHY
ncbi:MAG: protein kinase [Anaerolineae bacterium]|nr:protein kinase [Anaerolineae bacterium]MCA9894605.1 protein kinase [Anaerolineae bacterium]MCB9458256.1 protein kinase [Anaerolineaceae bacterium]